MGHGSLTPVRGKAAAAIETFARFQTGFLSSEGSYVFYRVSWLFIDFHEVHAFSFLLSYFGHGSLTLVRGTLLALYKPLLDSRLASCPLRTFIVFVGFS